MGDEERRGSTEYQRSQHEEDEQMVAGAWPANVKRTYDEYQDVALTSARRSQEKNDQLANVALQALQNAVLAADALTKSTLSTMDMTAKQAIKHSDVSVTANLGVGVAAEGIAGVVVKSMDAQNTVLLKAMDANNTVLIKSIDASITPLIAVLTDLVVKLSAKQPSA